jgi:hypothetical protein
LCFIKNKLPCFMVFKLMNEWRKMT